MFYNAFQSARHFQTCIRPAFQTASRSVTPFRTAQSTAESPYTLQRALKHD